MHVEHQENVHKNYNNLIMMKSFASEPILYRGSYISDHVLLYLLNRLWKRDKMRGLSSSISLFRNELNKFNNTDERMLDSIYH